MSPEFLYSERLSSKKTLLLFATLTVLFLAFALWRMDARGMDALAIALFVFSAFFLFYSINYRTLLVRLTSESLQLKFGIFLWTVPLDNVASCQLDELPALMKYGGAGIHFMMIRDRYRASFNFLEYPRVVVAFKRKRGLVWDISFSTLHPEEIIRLVGENIKT
jgi:hypothetical protein